MSDVSLLYQRLRNQHAAGNELDKAEDVVGLLCAVQSQDYPGAKWSLGQRVRGITDSDLDRQFSDGRFLRTHVLRPTWHFVLPEDIGWMLELTAPRVHALSAFMYRQHELDARLLKRARNTIERALADGNHLTRSEIGDVLERAGIIAQHNRLAYIMMNAELERVVCSGRLKGKQQTYALLSERAPKTRQLKRDEAVAELLFRFLKGHAPATLRHFVWWSGLTLADAKRAAASIASRIGEPVEYDGNQWYGLELTKTSSRSLRGYFIPEYDEALTGYRDLGTPDLPPGKSNKSWRDVFYRPVVVANSRAGTWKRTFKSKSAEIELNLFAKLDARKFAAVESAASRYAYFIGMPVTVTRPAIFP